MVNMLTFGELLPGDTFLLAGTTYVFQKTTVRKRSPKRPFSCNAKVVWTPGDAVKSGWLLDDTSVIKYTDNLEVYVGGVASEVPKGWLHVHSLQGVIDALDNYRVRHISVLADVLDMDKDSSILGSIIVEIENRLDSRYIKRLSAYLCMSSEEVPNILVRSDSGLLDRPLSEAANRRLQIKINECLEHK